MSEQGDTTVGPRLFQNRKAGFATQRILQARRRQNDSGSPVNDLGTISENNVASSTTSSTCTTPEVQSEEPQTGFFRRAFRSRQLRGSFRERELEDLDAKANQYSKQVRESSVGGSYSTPATPEVMHEANPLGGRKFELYRRSSVPAEFEEEEEPNLNNHQYLRSMSLGQTQFGDDVRESIVARMEAERSSPALSGLASMKQRHAMMAQKFQKMLSADSEEPEDEVANGPDQPSDILQQMSENPRLASIYQRITSLGLNKPQPSSYSPAFDHIDTLECDKPKSRTSFDRSSFLRESIGKRPTPTAVNQTSEVSKSLDSSPLERVEQNYESQTLPRRSYLNTKQSIGSANSDSSPSYSVASLKRQSYKTGAKTSLLDEDPFLQTSSDFASPTYDTQEAVRERFNRIEPESNFLASMQALRAQISNLHLQNDTKENHSISHSEFTNGVQSDAHSYGTVANEEALNESQMSDVTVLDDSSLNQTQLNTTFTLETSTTDKSPDRQVLGAEKTPTKNNKSTPKTPTKKPTGRNEKPTVKARAQSVNNEKPAVRNEKPVVKKEKPAVKPKPTVAHKPVIKTEKRSVRNETPIKKEPLVANKNEKTPVKTEKVSKPRSAVRASSAKLSVGSSSITRSTASVANKQKAKENEADKKPTQNKKVEKSNEKNTKGPGTLKITNDKPKEVLSPPRVRKFTDNLAHGGSGVLDVRVTSTDTISSGRNSLESQTDSNQAASDNADEVFIDEKNFITNLDREASLSVDSIEGAEKTVELADIKRLAAARRSVRSTSSDYSASFGGRSSRSPGSKLRSQISDVSDRLKAFVKKQQHGKGAHREDPDGEEVQSGGYSDGELKRRSTSDLSMSSSANTGMSRRSSLWSEAKPIMDSAMRNKLRSASGARVNAKDQRILELMMKKREEAQRQQQLRETAQMAWEEEKARSSSRRSSLAEPRSKSQPRLKDRSRLSSVGSSSPHTPRRNDIDDKSCDKTPSSVSRVMLERERKQLEKKRANLERKKSQEQRLAEQEREKALLNSQIKAKQEQDLRRAEKLKEAKEKEEAKQRKMKSYYVKKRQEEKISQIRKQSEEEQEQLAAALDQKMSMAENNLQARQERRLADAKQAMTDLERRLELSKLNQKRMQEEMQNWHSELQNYRKMMDEKAKEQTRRQLEEKRARAAEELAQKKRLQQENMQRLLEQEDEWKNDVEATIAMKDARSKMIAMEKDELLKESRSLAQASQLLREELRMAYEIDHIDKMNRRAELEARIQKPL